MAKVSVTNRALELVSTFHNHGYEVKAVEIDKTKIRVEFIDDGGSYNSVDEAFGRNKLHQLIQRSVSQKQKS